MNNISLAQQGYISRLKRKIVRVLGAWGVFFKGFVKHPVMVGSIIPSSNNTVKKMLEPVKWDECDLFVEYGPGVGTFCEPVLQRLKPGATLLVIDLNADFIEYLQRTITDSRFIAVHGSAADVKKIINNNGFEQANYILSGLPFSTLPGDLGDVIARETGEAIKSGGAFLVYQFRARARDFMQPYFENIDNGFSVWNILPCHLFWGWKQ